jgi:hypothetical protein
MDMSETPPFGSRKCSRCKGTGINPWGGSCECDDGWILPKGEDIVMGASDAIVPIVQDNEFSREALEKAIHSGSAATKRRVILTYLHDTFPKAVSSSQMEEIQGWLHQSCSSTFTSLHKAGLVSVVAWRVNQRNRREGMYTLSAIARGAWG